MSIEIISLIGIAIGLFCLIYFAYKGVSIYILGPGCAIIIALIGGLNVIDALSGPYMTGFTNFMKNYFLLFFLGATFAMLMGDSGAAKIIALQLSKVIKLFPESQKFFAACVMVGVVNSVFTMGGVNLFVVIFVTLPIFKNMFEEMDIPWQLVLCSCWGSAAWTMTMMPGTPAIQNLIPMNYLGTTPTAAPTIGIICTVAYIALALVYCKWQSNLAIKRGEHFIDTGTVIVKKLSNTEVVKEGAVTTAESSMNWIYCLVPSIALLVLMNAFKFRPVTALLIGNVVAGVLFFKHLKNIMKSLELGASNSISAISQTCAVVGFGGVVAATAGYKMVLGGLTQIPGTPLIQIYIATNVAAGFTGSASGGLTIALESLSKYFLTLGVNPQVIHRVAAIGCGGLDSLPHNGAVVSSLGVHGLNHKQAYKHFWYLCTVIPLLIGLLAVALGSAGIV